MTISDQIKEAAEQASKMLMGSEWHVIPDCLVKDNTKRIAAEIRPLVRQVIERCWQEIDDSSLSPEHAGEIRYRFDALLAELDEKKEGTQK